jgi:hypothetical protein
MPAAWASDPVSIRAASKRLIRSVIYRGLAVRPRRRGCARRPDALRDAGLIACFTRNLIRRNGGMLRAASLNRLPSGNIAVPEGVMWHITQPGPNSGIASEALLSVR